MNHISAHTKYTFLYCECQLCLLEKATYRDQFEFLEKFLC